MSNFHQLEVVGRGSETQFQVGENLNSTGYMVRTYLISKNCDREFESRSSFKTNYSSLHETSHHVTTQRTKPRITILYMFQLLNKICLYKKKKKKKKKKKFQKGRGLGHWLKLPALIACSSPTRSLVKIQYCGEPPWPRGSVLGLRPPGLEFQILCLEGSVISFIASSSGSSPVPV